MHIANPLYDHAFKYLMSMATKYGASPQQIAEDMSLPLQRVLEIVQEK